MRELIYTVAGITTKSYEQAQKVAELKNEKIKSKVVDVKEENPRKGKYAGISPKFLYVALYKY